MFGIFTTAVILLVLSTLSLLTPNEGARGLGRVAGGLSWILIGWDLFVLSYGYHILPFDFIVPSIFILVSGLITALLGLRKFLRRNLPAPANSKG